MCNQSQQMRVLKVRCSKVCAIKVIKCVCAIKVRKYVCAIIFYIHVAEELDDINVLECAGHARICAAAGSLDGLDEQVLERVAQHLQGAKMAAFAREQLPQGLGRLALVAPVQRRNLHSQFCAVVGMTVKLCSGAGERRTSERSVCRTAAI